ncbi:hypothetical protein B0H14DRAFT_3908021 [Mycena olivaceomarginata]|nr:hypothetical protein B0H14DRAFT_3908021 [Mycena olivaceomarginata]
MNRTAINYGVEEYIDYGPAKNFFACFDVPTQPIVQFAANTIYADPATSTLLPNITYTPYLLPGDWNFSPSDAIPANMLLPWADFEAKYGPKIVNASVDVSASTHEGDRLDTPLSFTARAARLHRGHIHNIPSSPCHYLLSHAHPSGCCYPGPRPPRCPPHRHSRALPSSTTTLTVHGSHSSYSYSCTAVAHQQSGLLDRSPARRSPRAVGWHRICGSVRGEARVHNTPHSATSGGAVRVRDYHPGRGQDATHLVACCGERPQRRRCGVDCLGGMHHDGV